MQDFEAYVTARTPALLRYAHVLTGDRARAEDLVQGALASSYRHWSRLSARGDVDAYVRRAVLNAHLNRWRRVGRRESLVAEPPEGALPDGVDRLADRDAVWRALATLPPRQRAVLVLRFYEDLTEAGVAAELGISVGTVKSQTSKGLTKLRAVAGLREPVEDQP